MTTGQKLYKTDELSALPCPCGSGMEYDSCCRIIHLDHAAAETPEALMRARYSAYSLAKEDFIIATWMRDTRPSSISPDPDARWITLEIIDTGCSNGTAEEGFVTFSASFIKSDRKYTLTETSRFLKRFDRWFYLDGKAEFTSVSIGGNERCPCGSGKKFKRCCKNR